MVEFKDIVFNAEIFRQMGRRLTEKQHLKREVEVGLPHFQAQKYESVGCNFSRVSEKNQVSITARVKAEVLRQAW